MISRKGYQKLINITNKKLLCTHVAYNLRFNNLIINLKKIIDSNIHGRILNVDISITSNFKKWRPNKNYYETVSAQKKFGGGVINELSHDFDYMLYLFGKPIAVTSKLSYSRDKRIDVETKSINSFRYKDFLINLYQDMCSDKEERKCIVDFEKAKIVLDFNKNKICVIKDQKKKYIIKKDAMASTYENQFDYFMKCVKSKSKSSMSISDNKLLFKTLSSVKLSHKNSKEIRI
jgi:predicted dehydrogenase